MAVTPDRPARLKIEMPIPYFTFSNRGREDMEPVKSIAIDATSIDGVLKRFLWAQNLSKENSHVPDNGLLSTKGYTWARLVIASMKHEFRWDVYVGQAVDLDQTKRNTDRVILNDDPNRMGWYVEEKYLDLERTAYILMATPLFSIEIPEDLTEYREFCKLYRRAKFALPLRRIRTP